MECARVGETTCRALGDLVSEAKTGRQVAEVIMLLDWHLSGFRACSIRKDCRKLGKKYKDDGRPGASKDPGGSARCLAGLGT